MACPSCGRSPEAHKHSTKKNHQPVKMRDGEGQKEEAWRRIQCATVHPFNPGEKTGPGEKTNIGDPLQLRKR